MHQEHALPPQISSAFGEHVYQFGFAVAWGTNRTRLRIVYGSRACLVIANEGKPSARLASYWLGVPSALGDLPPLKFTPSTIAVFDKDCNGTPDRIHFDTFAVVPKRPADARTQFNQMVDREFGDVLRATDRLLSALSTTEPFRSNAFGHAHLPGMGR